MIDNSNQNYLETIDMIQELKMLIVKIERNFLFQIPQGINNEFVVVKRVFLNWVEEAEFNLEEYSK